MRKTLSILLVVLSLTISAIAQVPSEAAVDKFIKSEMERQKIPGVSIAVVQGGKPLIVKGYGMANVEHNVPVKPETIFQSGSVGKQFTAFAIMLLVEEGKIGLDDPLSKYIPDVPDSWKPLTIRRLLTHTSGLGDYPNDFNLQKDGTEAEIFKELQKTSPTFKPGEKWEYSNVAYVTLGVLIRKVTGQFYGDFLRERVFKPLGMSTRIISEADIVPNRAAGYQLVNGELKNQEWVAPTLNTTADGALYMTSLDLIKWDEALRAGKLLKKQSYDEMWSRVKLSDSRTHPYGFGWAVKQVNGKRLVEHGGSWQGFKTYIARYIDNDLTVIVFANLAQANPERLARGIAFAVDPSVKPQPISDPDPKFTDGIRELLAAVIGKRADMGRFTPDVQKVIERSGDRVTELVKPLGPMQKFNLIERVETSPGTQYSYRLEYSGATLNLAVTVDLAGKIAAFSLQPE